MSDTLNNGSSKLTGAQIWVVIGCLFNYLFGVGYATTSMGGLLPIMAEEYGWSTAQWGALAGALPMGVACIVAFAGIAQDKFSPRKLMIIALMVLGVAVAFRGIVSNFALAMIFVLVSGASSCIFETGNPKMLTLWFDRKRSGKIYGVLFTGVAAGYFFGLTLSMWLTELLGSWQRQFIFIGAVMFISSAIWIFAIPERKASAMDTDLHVDEERQGHSVARRIKDVLTSKQALCCILTETLTNAPIFAFSTIGPVAFVDLWDISQARANWIVSISSLCGILAYTVMPWIGDAVGKRKLLGMPALWVSTTLYMTSLFTHNEILSMIMIGSAGTLNGWGLVSPRLLMLEHEDVAGVNAGTASGIFFVISKFFQAFVPTLYVAFTAMCSGNKYLGWTCVFIIAEIGVFFLFATKDTGLKSKYTMKRMADAEAAKAADRA